MNLVGDNQWFNDATRFVDAEDIEDMGMSAINLLRDLIVKRPVELGTLRSLFKRSLKQPIHLLPSQLETMRLADEAKLKNITPTTYISQELGIHRRSAYDRLQTLNRRLIFINYQSDTKTLTYDNNMAIVDSEATVKIELPIDVIDKRIKNDRVACPTRPYYDGCSGTAYVRLGLCPECHEHFKSDRDGIPEWVTFLRNDIRTEARKEARHALAVEKYGVDVDVSDIY